MKPIFLQTTPHTGTNTAVYLFQHLGGIPVFFIHFGDWEMSEFLDKIHGYREQFVWLHTARPRQDVLASYKKRMPEYSRAPEHPNSAENLLARNWAVEEKWHREFSEAFVLPIGVDVTLQTDVAKLVFKACGAEVPDSAKRFLETWPAYGTFPTGEPGDTRGWDSEEEMMAMRDVMRGYRVLPKNRGEDNLNEFIQGLSN